MSKAVQKGKLVVRVATVSRVRYEQIGQEILGEFACHRPLYLPYSTKVEAILVHCFLREGKWPSTPVERYKSGKDVLSLFKFNGDRIITESVGQKLFVLNSTKMDSWFRFSIVRPIMMSSEDLAPFAKEMRNIQELATLGDLWKQYVDSNIVSPSFGEWLKTRQAFISIATFRKAHVRA